MKHIATNFTRFDQASRLDAFSATEAIMEQLQQSPPNIDHCLREMTTLFLFAKNHQLNEIKQLADLIEKTLLGIRQGSRTWTKQLQGRLMSYCGLMTDWLDDPDCGSGQDVPHTATQYKPDSDPSKIPSERLWNLIAQLTPNKFITGKVTLPDLINEITAVIFFLADQDENNSGLLYLEASLRQLHNMHLQGVELHDLDQASLGEVISAFDIAFLQAIRLIEAPRDDEEPCPLNDRAQQRLHAVAQAMVKKFGPSKE